MLTHSLGSAARRCATFGGLAAALVAGWSCNDFLDPDPRDVLALQVGHMFDYATGDVGQLTERVAKVMPAWSRELPGYHAVLSMRAFGLVESGEYELAGEAAFHFQAGTFPFLANGRARALGDTTGMVKFLADAATEDAYDEALERAWQQRDRLREIGRAAGRAIRELVPPDPARRFADQLVGLIEQAERLA